MIGGAALALAVSSALAAPSSAPAFCGEPAHCDGEALCVGGLCRDGAARSRVQPVHVVAVPPPVAAEGRWLARRTERLGASIREALRWSGFYRVEGREGFPDGWRREGASPAATDRLAWQRAGVTRVLRLAVQPSDAPWAFRVRIRAVEVERQAVREPLDGAVTVRPGEVSHVAARLVDELVRLDTGRAGAQAGRLVASFRTDPGTKEIGLLDPDGEAFVWLTANHSLNLAPARRDDGRIGYVGYGGGDPDWVVEGEPLDPRPGLDVAGAWSPDGELLALSRAEGANSDLYLLEARTGETVRRLTDDPGVDTSPAWSPDGQELVFVSDRRGPPGLWRIARDGGAPEPLATDGYLTNPDWSPHDPVIVYQRRTGSDRFALIRRNLDTGATRRLTPPGMNAQGPAFSPDGRYVVFVRADEVGGHRLWRVEADGDRAVPVGGPDREAFQPDWSPGFGGE